MARSRLDADRLAAAYERDARRLLVFFTRRTYDAQLAVDLVGETYARAFELRRRFDGDADDADALAAWVFGIGRNVLNEELRRGAVERRAMRRAGVQAPTLAGEELIRIEELAALGELRPAVAGARCDIAAGGDGTGGVSPRILAERLVQTYFDPVAGRTWAFGALPAAARSVDVAATGARATVGAAAADPKAVGRGDLPAGMRVFVAALDGARDVPLVTARDGAGAVLLVCRGGRCTAPPPTEGSQ
jgi:ribosomal protein L18